MTQQIDVGHRVSVQTCGAFGRDLPYEALVEKIDGDRVRVRPLHPVLTAGSARSSRTRKGPSIRARWVSRFAVGESEGRWPPDEVRADGELSDQRK